MGGSQPAVEMRGITKVYPDGVVALRDVDFTVRKGEVHGLLGENGAGKTTLMRILYGEIEPSRGEIWIFGRRVKFRGPWDAIRQGVYMVYQQFSLVPAFTVLENLILASSSMGRAKLQDVRRKAEKIEREIGLEVPLNARVEELSVGVQQKAEILKALMSEAKILVLDEPTSVLTPIEVRELMKLLSRLREMGITIIFITHKLREAKEITDRITVLRRGRVVKVVETRDVSQEELAKMMVGREITFDITKKAAKVGAPLLVVKDLWVRDDRGLMAVKGVSFELRAGEILSIVGVAGNGQRELVEAIVGIRPVEKGEVVFSGESITQMPPSEVYRRGLVYIPDSRAVGLILDFNVTDNSILTRL
ncbi:MAG TPA: ATP-binding cassette domain-containing protein, partial [Candidatus Bathyarchaeota archaeon]|nr:ATP-binding cassette domain-containing protein [Candidatus Bathyarchaeota archaeon]